MTSPHRLLNKVPLVLLACLLLIGCQAASIAPAPETLDDLPPARTASRARFDIAVSLGEVDQPMQIVEYGNGAFVLPDRLHVATVPDVDDPSVYLRTITQVGSEVYVAEPSVRGWQRADNAELLFVQSILLVPKLLHHTDQAEGVVRIDDEPLPDLQATHYQAWFDCDVVARIAADIAAVNDPTREQIDRATGCKLDYWLDEQGHLRRHNLELDLPPNVAGLDEAPRIRFTQLVTYKQLDDPAITIEAPIR